MDAPVVVYKALFINFIFFVGSCFVIGYSLSFSLSYNAFIYHLRVNNGRVKCVNVTERVVFMVNSAFAGGLFKEYDLAVGLLFKEHCAAVGSLFKLDGAGLVFSAYLADVAGYASVSVQHVVDDSAGGFVGDNALINKVFVVFHKIGQCRVAKPTGCAASRLVWIVVVWIVVLWVIVLRMVNARRVCARSRLRPC